VILLRLISWPDARKHVLRSLLTTAGIMLGIAVFIAMHLANGSILATFGATVDRIAGSTQLQISAGEGGFEEDVLEKVQAVPQVQVAVPVIEAVVSTGRQGQGNLKILAVDMTGDGNLREYKISGEQEGTVEDPLVFLAQPDSLIVSKEFGARNALKVNDPMVMSTMDGEKRFTIRGMMRSGGLASAFGGNLAVMDIYAAQKVFGRGRRFDRIDLRVKEGTTVEEGRRALISALGPGFTVEAPAARNRQFESLLRVYSTSMTVCSLFALFIGMFMIYNSMLIAVTQRRKEIGILRALGATRAQIQLLFLGESAVTGLVGSILGLVLGELVAARLSGYVSGLMQGIYGAMEPPQSVPLEPWVLVLTLGTGLVASVVSAVIPARQAARVDPAIALQKGQTQSLDEQESRARQIGAGVAALASIICLYVSEARAVFYIGYMLIAVVAVLLAPTLTMWLAKAMRPMLLVVAPVEGALAAESLLRAPRRTSSTAAALMFSLAMAIGLGGLARSTLSSVEDWMSATLNAPLFVTATEGAETASFHFPAAMLPELRAINGIEEVEPVRNLKVNMSGHTVLLLSTDLRPFSARTRGRRVIAGDYDVMHRLASEGKGVVVSENFAELQKLKQGDLLRLTTAHGKLALPVTGIVKDYSEQEGTIFMERSLYARYWNDESADVFRIYLKKGASADDVKRTILGRFAKDRRLFVLSTEDVKRYVLGVVDQWFSLTYIQIAIAVLVSILGILNTLTVSITERKRELGVLRAIGGLMTQVRVAIWLEAVAVAVVGLVLGFALGAANLYYTLQMVRRDFTGMALGYEFPSNIALALIPIILAAAVIAAFSPAEYAVRTPIVEALEYE